MSDTDFKCRKQRRKRKMEENKTFNCLTSDIFNISNRWNVTKTEILLLSVFTIMTNIKSQNKKPNIQSTPKIIIPQSSSTKGLTKLEILNVPFLRKFVESRPRGKFGSEVNSRNRNFQNICNNSDIGCKSFKSLPKPSVALS